MINVSEVKKLLSEILEVDAFEMPEDAHFFEDLGVDSLRSLEILAALEKHYNIQIPPERLPELVDIRSTISIVNELSRHAG